MRRSRLQSLGRREDHGLHPHHELPPAHRSGQIAWRGIGCGDNRHLMLVAPAPAKGVSFVIPPHPGRRRSTNGRFCRSGLDTLASSGSWTIAVASTRAAPVALGRPHALPGRWPHRDRLQCRRAKQLNVTTITVIRPMPGYDGQTVDR